MPLFGHVFGVVIRFLPVFVFFLIEPLSEVTITPPGRVPVSVCDVSVAPLVVARKPVTSVPPTAKKNSNRPLFPFAILTVVLMVSPPPGGTAVASPLPTKVLAGHAALCFSFSSLSVALHCGAPAPLNFDPLGSEIVNLFRAAGTALPPVLANATSNEKPVDFSGFLVVKPRSNFAALVAASADGGRAPAARAAPAGGSVCASGPFGTGRIGATVERRCG